DLSNNEYPPRKLDVFIVQIAAITERVGIRGEKTFIGSHNEKTRRGLCAIVNRLPLNFVTKTFEANLTSLAFHQSVIMQHLLVGDVVPVTKFFPHVAAHAHISRVFGELKNVGTEEANAVLN